MRISGKNRWILACLCLSLLLTACGGGKKESEEHTEYAIDPQTESLTIAGAEGSPAVYTRADLEKLGLETRTYSARGKEKKNARQFLEFSGVDLDTLLEDAGYSTKGVFMKVFCSDGYVREYDVEELFDRYVYEDNASGEKKPAAPMIALADDEKGWEYPSPFRLVYGQADYDTGQSMDFNMQGWASYVQYIEVSYQ